MDVNADPTTEEKALLRRLKSIQLPPSSVDGLDFPEFVRWWIGVLAQLSVADLVPGIGGKDGDGDPATTLKWKIKEGGTYLFGCVTDTDLYLGASAHMIDGIELRKFIFENCAPNEAVEVHLRAAVSYLDKPVFKHSTLQAWFREIQYCLAVCSNFAKAAFTPDHATFTRTEAAVIKILGLPPVDDDRVVPWNYHVAMKISDEGCDTLKKVEVIATKVARFQSIVGDNVTRAHVSSVRSLLPSRSGTSARTVSFRGHTSAVSLQSPLCPGHSPAHPCADKSCTLRHVLTDTESSLFDRVAAAEARARACEATAGARPDAKPPPRQKRGKLSPAEIAERGKESCMNYTADRCKFGDKCYRKHDKPPAAGASAGATSSVQPATSLDAATIASVVAQMSAAGWAPPTTSSVQMPAGQTQLAIGAPAPPATSSIATSQQAASLLQVLMRNGGGTCALDSPVVSEIVSAVGMDQVPLFGASTQGFAPTGETQPCSVLFDSGSSITGTADVGTLSDIRWFDEPVALTVADADSTGAVALGVGAAHFRLVNDMGTLVTVAVVHEFVVPCFKAEEIISARSFKRDVGGKIAYKDGDDLSEFLRISKSGEMIPIIVENDRDFITATKLKWDSDVPARYLKYFASTQPPRAPRPDPARVPAPLFSELPEELSYKIIDSRVGSCDDRRGAMHIKSVCAAAGIDVDRRAAAGYRDAADLQIEANVEAQRAHMAALFLGIPRPYSLAQAAQIAFHASTNTAPTLTAIAASGTPLSDWARMPDPTPSVVNEEAWRIETGLARAERAQGLADVAVLADVMIQEAADRLPQSSLLDDLYSSVGTHRGDLPGCDLTKPAAYQAVVAAVYEHCLDLDVPFNTGHIIDLVGAPGGVEAVIKRVAQGLASASEASPLDAEPPPPPCGPDIIKLRTCLVGAPPGIGAPASASNPTWPVSKSAKKLIDGMPLASILRTLQQLPPDPVSPEEQADRAASGGAEHNRNEVQYMRLRAARMGTYCWHSQHDVLLRLHEKLGHRNWRDTAATARAQGFKLDSVAEAYCDACLRVKTTRQEPTRDRPEQDESDLLTRWHVDVSGPHTTSRLGAHRYATVFVAKGGTTLVYFSPNMLNFQDIQRQFIDDVRKMHSELPGDPVIDVHAASWRDGHHVTTDGAKYFTSAPAQALWQREKFAFHVSAPLTPALNGAAERKIRTLNSSAKCMLLFRDQPANMWPEAWRCARAVDDLMPTNSDPSRLSPYTQRTGKQPDLSTLHPAFCPVYVWQNSADRDKEAPGARKGVYIGPDPMTDCCAVLIEGATRAQRVTSRHIRVIEDLPGRVSNALVMSQYHVVDPDVDVDLECIDIDQVLQEQRHPDPDTINLDYYGASAVSFAVPIPVLSDNFSTAMRHFDLATVASPYLGKVSSAGLPAAPTVVDTALSPDDVLWLAGFAAKTRGDDPDLHYNYSTAKRCERFGHLVEDAAVKELTGLLKDKGCLAQIMLADVDGDDPRIHRCLPLFHPKYKNVTVEGDDSTAVFDRYKCRITFNGSTQVQGIDYDISRTNQPRFESWRLHMGVVCGATAGPGGHYIPPTDKDENYTLGGDVPMAYTNATPTSTVLVELPRDVYHLALDHDLVAKDPSGRCICRVLKCQYGQCDAGRLWENVWVEDMLARGFTQSVYERCLFYRDKIRVLCHTDDFLVRGNKAQCLAFAAEMDERWGDCKCVAFPKEILSWNLSYDDNNAITLSSLGQINGMLKSLDMDSTYRRHTPMPSSAEPATWKSSEHCGVTKVVQSMNGSLNHIAQTTRPDMSFACNKFGSCQYMPSTAVIPSLRHSYKYMFNTKHWGLSFSAPFTIPGSGTNVLQVWVDASDGDCEESKSQTGFLVGMNGGAVDWGSHVQKTTSLCTGESELKASCKAARSAVFMIKLLSEFGYPPVDPVVMHEDNTTAIKWSLPEFSLSDKNKHVDRQFFYVQQLQTQTPPLLNMVHCPTDLQRADLLTKNLGRAIHNRLCEMIFVDTNKN